MLKIWSQKDQNYVILLNVKYVKWSNSQKQSPVLCLREPGGGGNEEVLLYHPVLRVKNSVLYAKTFVTRVNLMLSVLTTIRLKKKKKKMGNDWVRGNSKPGPLGNG